MILRKQSLKVGQVSKHTNIIKIHRMNLKFTMLVEHSIWHTVVKGHKNTYVSFRYIICFKWKRETLTAMIFKYDCRQTMLIVNKSMFLTTLARVVWLWINVAGNSHNNRMLDSEKEEGEDVMCMLRWARGKIGLDHVKKCRHLERCQSSLERTIRG